jgi:phosphoserine phosphatase
VIQTLTFILEEHHACVLNSDEVRRPGAAALVMTIEVGSKASTLRNGLLTKLNEMGATAQFVDESQRSGGEQRRNVRYVITALGPSLKASHLARLADEIAACHLHVDAVERLSSRESLSSNSSSGSACVQFRVSGENPDSRQMRASFLALAQETGIDVAFEEAAQYGRSRRLIAFDMDSTLIQAEIIDELAKMKGVGDEVARITEAAMRGELDFKQSFTRRLSLLRGLPEARVCELLDRVPLSNGAERLISTLKSHGYRTAILSGGFTFFGERLQSRLGIDYLHANVLEIKDGFVTGNVVLPIMDGQRKAEMLTEIAAKEDIPLEDVVAVGDGANDLPMMGVAGMGIAYWAKPLVRQNAQHSISTLGLDAILYLLGMHEVAAQIPRD